MIKAMAIRIDLYERTIVWLLSALTIAALACYAYFLILSVFAVVARNNAENQIQTVQGRLAQEEVTYAALGQKITLALAKEKGYVEVVAPKYFSLQPSETKLTIRDN